MKQHYSAILDEICIPQLRFANAQGFLNCARPSVSSSPLLQQVFHNHMRNVGGRVCEHM
jgi:hypothetical protein